MKLVKNVSPVSETSSGELLESLLTYHNLGKNARWGLIKRLLPEPKYDEHDDEDEERAEPRVKLGDIWQLGKDHRLMCGDSTDIVALEKLIAEKPIDMIYTDPPYGLKKGEVVGIKGATKAGSYVEMSSDHSTETAIKVYQICATLGVPIKIFWGANYYASTLPDGMAWIVWNKETVGDQYADAELAWTNQKGRVRMFTHQWHGMIKESEQGQKRLHPTQKPIALAEWCFAQFGAAAQTVLDPFGGSGSTLIACHNTDRWCRIMEIEPTYCDVIIARFEQHTKLKAVKIE